MKRCTIISLLATGGLAFGCSAVSVEDENVASRDEALTTVEPAPGCLTATDKPASLTSVAVAGLPADEGEVLVGDGAIVLALRTGARDAVSFEVEATLRGNGQTATLPIATGRVTAASAATVRLPIDASAVGGFDAASLRIEVRAVGADGKRDRTYAPVVLLRRDATGQLFAARTYGSGPYTFVGGKGDSAGIPGPTGVVAFPPPDGRWHFCFRWEITAVDSGFGEDFHANNEPVAARGAKIKVEHNGASLFDGNADANGCVHFASPEQSGFKVTARSEAKLGPHGMIAHMPNAGAAQWTFSADPFSLPKWVGFNVDSGDKQIAANLIAFTSHTIHRITTNTADGVFLGGTVDVFSHVHPDPICTEGCKSGDNIFLKSTVTDEKFGVSHEVGHWLHGQLVGQTADDGGDYDDNDPLKADCKFNPNDGPGAHAMRSREEEAAAFTEGVAHFIAALAWNNHNSPAGSFRYYKAIATEAYQDMANASWVVDLSPDGDIPVGGQNNWYHDRCTQAGNAPAKSVELDWLRFFWNLRTDEPGSDNGNSAKPSHQAMFQLLKLVKPAYPFPGGGGVYKALDAIVQGPQNPGIALARWNACTVTYGVVQP